MSRASKRVDFERVLAACRIAKCGCGREVTVDDAVMYMCPCRTYFWRMGAYERFFEMRAEIRKLKRENAELQKRIDELEFKDVERD